MNAIAQMIARDPNVDQDFAAALATAHEVALCDMTEAELAVVIIHDPDPVTRRDALRMYRNEILLKAETRVFNLLGEIRKEGK